MHNMRFRKAADGKIFAPRRGKPPAIPNGYIRDPADDYIFIPILAPCNARTEKLIKSKCCSKGKHYLYCKRTGKVIIYSRCQECIRENKHVDPNSSKRSST
jgi:hypothetical protein